METLTWPQAFVNAVCIISLAIVSIIAIKNFN